MASLSEIKSCALWLIITAGVCWADEDVSRWQAIYGTQEPWVKVNFFEAMKVDTFSRQLWRTEHMLGIDGKELLTLCKNLFERFNPAESTPDDVLRIPKIIHQIWLGSEPPAVLKKYMRTWIDQHYGREWRYILWTDEMLEQFPLYNRKYYDEAWNYALKADIARYEIVYHFGGVYVDVDFECLKPLDILHYTYDFYAGLQPLDSHFLQVGMAIFAARPKHPILAHCIVTIENDWHLKGVPAKTGPMHFTKSFFLEAGKDDNRDVALPANYFYPLGAQEIHLPATPDVWRSAGAFAVHHWAKTWMPPHYRTDEFKCVQNYESTQAWNDR